MSTEPRERTTLGTGHMTIWEHLAELRGRIIKCFIGIALGALVGWVAYPWILEISLGPYQDIKPDAQLYVTDPLELFTVRLQISAYVGIALAMPVILWQLWRFITPGLYPHEKRYAVPFIASSMALFALGATLAYFALTPALEFLIGLGGDQVQEIFSQERYLSLITYMMLAFGIGFEVPVLLVALQLIGVVTPRRLLGWWRIAIVLIAVAAAVITPSGDPITMLALVLPMVVLYFGAIGIGAVWTYRRDRRRDRSDAPR
jgi:sec-independent protein translocase protein TatC